MRLSRDPGECEGADQGREEGQGEGGRSGADHEHVLHPETDKEGVILMLRACSLTSPSSRHDRQGGPAGGRP